MIDYNNYQHLLVEVNDGVALITMNRPEVLNATDDVLHNELGEIWLDIGRDPDVRVAVVTGAGCAFSAGGDQDGVEELARLETTRSAEAILRTMQEAAPIVYDMVNLDKPQHFRDQRCGCGSRSGCGADS